MVILKWVMFCILFENISLGISEEFLDMYFYFENGTKIKTGTTAEIRYADSIISCTRLCTDSDCCAGSYQLSSRECYLYYNNSCYTETETASDWYSFGIHVLTKQYFDVFSTWFAAQSHCLDWGGRLATVSSLFENEYLINMTDRTQSVWIGGTDIGQEGNWTWSNPTRPMARTYWNKLGGQPNNYGGQNCLALYLLNNGVYTWADEDCFRTYHFICERQE